MVSTSGRTYTYDRPVLEMEIQVEDPETGFELSSVHRSPDQLGGDDFYRPDASVPDDEHSLGEVRSNRCGPSNRCAKVSKILAISCSIAGVISGAAYAMRGPRNDAIISSIAPSGLSSSQPTLTPTLAQTTAPSQSPTEPSFILSPSFIDQPSTQPSNTNNSEPPNPQTDDSEISMKPWLDQDLLYTHREVFSDVQTEPWSNLLDYAIYSTEPIDNEFLSQIENSAVECLLVSKQPWDIFNPELGDPNQAGALAYLNGRPGLVQIFTRGDEAEFDYAMNQVSNQSNAKVKAAYHEFKKNSIDQCDQESLPRLNRQDTTAIRLENSKGSLFDIGVQSNCGSTQEALMSLIKMLKVNNPLLKVRANIDPWWSDQEKPESQAYGYKTSSFTVVKVKSSLDDEAALNCFKAKVDEQHDALVGRDKANQKQPDDGLDLLGVILIVGLAALIIPPVQRTHRG